MALEGKTSQLFRVLPSIWASTRQCRCGVVAPCCTCRLIAHYAHRTGPENCKHDFLIFSRFPPRLYSTSSRLCFSVSPICFRSSVSSRPLPFQNSFNLFGVYQRNPGRCGMGGGARAWLGEDGGASCLSRMWLFGDRDKELGSRELGVGTRHCKILGNNKSRCSRKRRPTGSFFEVVVIVDLAAGAVAVVVAFGYSQCRKL